MTKGERGGEGGDTLWLEHGFWCLDLFLLDPEHKLGTQVGRQRREKRQRQRGREEEEIQREGPEEEGGRGGGGRCLLRSAVIRSLISSRQGTMGGLGERRGEERLLSGPYLSSDLMLRGFVIRDPYATLRYATLPCPLLCALSLPSLERSSGIRGTEEGEETEGGA
jgi:hypothetical protein